MKKRILSIVLAVLMLVSALSITAFAKDYAYGETPDDGIYKLDDTIWLTSKRDKYRPDLYKDYTWDYVTKKTENCGETEHKHTKACNGHWYDWHYVYDCGLEEHKHSRICQTTYYQYKVVKKNKIDKEDRDSTKVYIAIMMDSAGNSFPNEPTQSSYSYWYYQWTDRGWQLNSSANPYSNSVDTLIDVAAFYNLPPQTRFEKDGENRIRKVDGDVNKSGHDLTKLTYAKDALKKLDQTALIRDWLRAEGKRNENVNDYELLIYVVKNEQGKGAISPGWHIDCKVVKKNSIKLIYNANHDDTYTHSYTALPANEVVITNGQTTNVAVKGLIGTAEIQKDGKTYAFDGWNTKADGTGTTYQPEQTVPMKDKDVILYAQWKDTTPPEPTTKTFTVTKVWNKNVPEDKKLPVQVNLVKNDVTQSGDGAEFTLNSRNQWTVTLAGLQAKDSQNRDNTYSVREYKIGEFFVRENTTTHELTATETAKNTDETEYTTGTYKVSMTGSDTTGFTITNTYEAATTYELTYSYVGETPDSATSAPEKQVGLYAGQKIDLAQVTAPEGWNFDGWYSNNTCAETSKVTSPYEVKGNATLYGKWSYTNPLVSYVYKTLAGVTITGDDYTAITNEYPLPTAQRVASGNTVEAPSTPVKDNTVEVEGGTWTFENWDIDKLEGILYDATFTGYWKFTAKTPEPDKVTLSFEFKSGTDNKDLPTTGMPTVPNPVTDAVGTEVTLTPTFENVVIEGEGTWEFKGWYSGENLAETSKVEGKYTMPSTNSKLYGKWTFEADRGDVDGYKVSGVIRKILKSEKGTFKKLETFNFEIWADEGCTEKLLRKANIYCFWEATEGAADEEGQMIPFSFEISENDFKNLNEDKETGYKIVYVKEVPGNIEGITYDETVVPVYLKLNEGSTNSPEIKGTYTATPYAVFTNVYKEPEPEDHEFTAHIVKRFENKGGKSPKATFTFIAALEDDTVVGSKTISFAKGDVDAGDIGRDDVTMNVKLTDKQYEALEKDHDLPYLWIYEVDGDVDGVRYDGTKWKAYIYEEPVAWSLELDEDEGLVLSVTDKDKLYCEMDGELVEDFVFTNVYRKSGEKGETIKSGPQLNRDDHVAYIMGYPDGTVQPEGEITRAEACTIFFRLLTDSSRDYYFSKTNDYSDVNAGDWFNNAISTLSNAGIVTGYNDGTFRPNQPITRGEMAKIIANFANLKHSGKTFTDLAGHWSKSYVELAAGNGWIAGYPDGSFRPDQKITRAETVTMINRVLERVPAKESRLLSRSIMLTFPDNNPGDWYYIAIQEASNSHEYQRSVYETTGDEMWTKLIENVDWTKLEK